MDDEGVVHGGVVGGTYDDGGLREGGGDEGGGERSAGSVQTAKHATSMLPTLTVQIRPAFSMARPIALLEYFARKSCKSSWLWKSIYG